MRRAVFTLFAWLLFQPVSSPVLTAPNRQSDPNFERAAEFFRHGRLQEARNEASRGLAASPEDHDGLNLMGAILDQLQRFDEAEAYYQKALKFYPRSPSLLNNLASHYLSWRKVGLAETFFLRVLKTQPHHFNAGYQLAQIALESGRANQAARYLDQLSHQDQTRPEVALLRARSLLGLKQTTKGIALLKQMEHRHPDHPAVAFSLGSVYYQNKLYPDARRCFEEATRLAPDDFEAHYNLGLTLAQLEHWEAATQSFERALRLQPDSADATYQLALAYFRQDRGEKSLELLYKVQQLEPNKLEVLLLVGQELLKLGLYQEALAIFDRYLQSGANEVEVSRLQALALAGLGRWTDVTVKLGLYLDKKPEEADAYLQRALAWKSLGRLQEAENDLRKLLQLQPSSREALIWIGKLELDRKNLAQAQEHFRKILLTSPNDPEALLGLGRAHLDAGQTDLAMLHLEKAAAQQAEPIVNYYLAAAYRQQGKSDQAATALSRWQSSLGVFRAQKQESRYAALLRKAVAAQPGNLSLRERLIHALLETGDLASAKAWIEETLKDSTVSDSQLRVGVMLCQHGYFREAVPYLEKAVSQPSGPAADLALARAYIETEQHHSALRILEKEWRDGQIAAEWLNLRAHVLSRSERYKDALEDYQKAIQLVPGQEAYYLDLIVFLIDTQAYDPAREALQAAAKLFPRSHRLALTDVICEALGGSPKQALMLLEEMEKHWPVDSLHSLLAGLVASSMDDRSVAKRHMERAVTLGTNDALPYYFLGLFESQVPESDVKAALAWAEISIQKDARLSEAHKLKGQLLIRLGNDREAVESLEQAVRLNPQSPDTLYVLSRAYSRLGDRAKSEEALSKSQTVRQNEREEALGGIAHRQLLVRIQSKP